MNSSLRIPGHRFLHSPGPTRVPDEVLHAMSRQPMDLADPRLPPIIESCEQGLRALLGTQAADVLMYAANGHGAWEAAMANLIAPGQSVLIPGTGHFSESWAVQTEALGGRVVRTPWAQGEPIGVAAVAQALRDDTAHEIAALCVVHTDTASGVTSELPAFRRALDEAGHPALLVVDVVASLGALPFHMDELGANVVIGASQKGLMCPPGLGFVAVDAKALAQAARSRNPRFYWDWERRRGSYSYQKFCGTAPQNMLMGLEAALRLILQEGPAQVFARHRLIAGAVHAAVQGWSEAGALGFFCRVPQARSVSVTTINVPAGTDVDQLRAVARERFQVAVAGGLGPLQGKAFRIGHLGDMNPAMILGCLGGVEAALKVLGIPHGGGVDKAVAFLAGA